MPKRLALVCLLPMVLSTSAFAQSDNKATPGFSCSGNLFPTEAVICSDQGLASLDRQLAAVYGSKLRNLPADQQAELKATERTWVAERNRCGTDRSCIRNAYQARTSLGGSQQSLQIIAQNPAAQPPQTPPPQAAIPASPPVSTPANPTDMRQYRKDAELGSVFAQTNFRTSGSTTIC